jgi:hypothetical protein
MREAPVKFLNRTEYLFEGFCEASHERFAAHIVDLMREHPVSSTLKHGQFVCTFQHKFGIVSTGNIARGQTSVRSPTARLSHEAKVLSEARDSRLLKT